MDSGTNEAQSAVSREWTAHAARVQQQLRNSRRPAGPFSHPPFCTVAGVDAAYSGDRVFGAVVIWNPADGRIIDESSAITRTAIPYVPGCLAFREGPAILKACAGLLARPDVMLFHGHGMAHPRRFGLASHMGLRLNIPSVGVAGRLLSGTSAEPGMGRGAAASIWQDGAVVGAAVRTRPGVRPVYVSPGHCTDLADAVSTVLHSCRGYRMPEPLRFAHQRAVAARDGASRE